MAAALAGGRKLPFDKYDLYSRAVQSPGEDVKFYLKTYRQLRGGRSPRILREDFCGAGAISCEWAKLDSRHLAYGLDLDHEPMNYGHEHYISVLTPDQQRRVQLLHKNVLSPGLPAADIAVAVNFSYFFFKKREVLLSYFRNVHRSLRRDGLFMVDIFGGTQCTGEIEDRTVHKGFTYYWDQKNFDPVTNEAYFEIHFRHKGKKYEGVFSYDWRMWTIPEVRELMREAGFRKTEVYWEGTAKDGSGNGKFDRVEKGEACESWIAYIVGLK